MIFGRNSKNGGRRIRQIVLLSWIGAAGVCLAHGAPAAESWQLSDLMQALKVQKTNEADFVEKRYLHVVDEPLESSGTLRFVPPDHLEKRTLKPKVENLIVDGDELTVERPNHHEIHLHLDERPEVAALVDSIRGTLAGDGSALEKAYRLQLVGGPDHWSLSLVPRSPSVARLVEQIRISGSRSVVAKVDFQFADGDRSEMTITRGAAP